MSILQEKISRSDEVNEKEFTKSLEAPGIDPGTSRMLNERSIFVYCTVYTVKQIPTLGHQEAPGVGGLDYTYTHT
jgi:hypothetical protein